jgi:hypothetical protein
VLESQAAVVCLFPQILSSREQCQPELRVRATASDRGGTRFIIAGCRLSEADRLGSQEDRASMKVKTLIQGVCVDRIRELTMTESGDHHIQSRKGIYLLSSLDTYSHGSSFNEGCRAEQGKAQKS